MNIKHYTFEIMWNSLFSLEASGWTKERDGDVGVKILACGQTENKFVPRYDSFPINLENKDTRSLYLQCLRQSPFLNSPKEDINSKFPQ